MVKRLIIKLLLEVGSSLGKSFLKAYQETAKQQRNKPNQFTDFLNSTLQAANLTHRPMNAGEALKVLNLEADKATPEVILQVFWRQFHKNDPAKGGSFYLQSMIHNAKCELMKNFPDVIEEDIIKQFKEAAAQEKKDEEEEADELKKEEEAKKEAKEAKEAKNEK